MLTAFQIAFARVKTRQFIGDQEFANDFVLPFWRQVKPIIAGLDEPTVTSLLATGDFTAQVATMQAALVTNEKMDAATVGTGPFAGFLTQLFTMLSGLLTSCFAAPPTPTQVLAMLQ